MKTPLSAVLDQHEKLLGLKQRVMDEVGDDLSGKLERASEFCKEHDAGDLYEHLYLSEDAERSQVTYQIYASHIDGEKQRELVHGLLKILGGSMKRDRTYSTVAAYRWLPKGADETKPQVVEVLLTTGTPANCRIESKEEWKPVMTDDIRYTDNGPQVKTVTKKLVCDDDQGA